MPKPNMFSVFKASYNVVRVAMRENVDENYNYQLLEREMLHERTGPTVQAVNQHLDKEGVPLSEEHIPHIVRGHEIDRCQRSGFSQTALQQWQGIQNESVIAHSFYREYMREQKKGESGDDKVATYAMAGYVVHTLFGSFKSAANPYFAFESDLEIGVTSHNLSRLSE